MLLVTGGQKMQKSEKFWDRLSHTYDDQAKDDEQYYIRAVESIQKHTAENYEILFVHNGMTKGAANCLQHIVRDTANCHLIDTRDVGYAES